PRKRQNRDISLPLASEDSNRFHDRLSFSHSTGSLRVEPLQVSLQILFLDRGPTDRTFLGLQYHPSIRFEAPKNLSAMLLPLSTCPETSSPKGLLVGSLRRLCCMNVRKVGRKTTRVQSQ